MNREETREPANECSRCSRYDVLLRKNDAPYDLDFNTFKIAHYLINDVGGY